MKKYFSLFLFLLISTQSYAVEELVMNSETSFSPTFQNRFSFLLGLNPSAQKASDITDLNFSYGKKLEKNSEDYWPEATVLFTNGVFNKLTTNNPTATGLTNDQLDGTKSSMLTFGVGIGRESHYAQTLLPFKNIYELSVADLTYNIYKESTSGKVFTGPGMIAKFSLYKKFSDYFSAGTHFTYNLAVVKRSANDDSETSSARSLTMSYLTLGLDLSFYL